jgi:hypothetical protein
LEVLEREKVELVERKEFIKALGLNPTRQYKKFGTNGKICMVITFQLVAIAAGFFR